jgi:hypothetical protein
MLQLTCHHGCRSVLSGMVVTDKVSCSNKNDKHEFAWTWTVPARVNASFFHLALQCYFSLKTIACFCLTCVLAFLTKPSLGLQVYKKGIMYNRQAESNLSQLAHTGLGILSHSCHRLDRPLSLQGASISKLHPCSSHFSIEDGGSMLL